MPTRSLLDLPPELIEQIFEQHELLAQSELEDSGDEDAVIGAPVFRLTNRYIEKCTRRAFITKYYWCWQVKTSDDTSVREFSAMAQVPELARCVNELIVYADNDDTMAVHQETALSQTAISLASLALGPSETASLRSSIISALRACSNIKDLTICPASRKCDLGPPGEAQTTTWLQYQPEAKGFLFDMSSSFAYALSLAEEAGIFPVSVCASANRTDHEHLICGLTAFTKAEIAFRKLEHLELVLVQERLGPGEDCMDQ